MNLITYTKEHFREKNILYGFLAALLFLAVFCCTCTVQAAIDPDRTPEEIPGLTFDHTMELSYAEEFSVDYYNDGYALITIDQEGEFLVVPEGKEVPEGSG